VTARPLKVGSIAVPAGRRRVLHPETVRALAGDILRNGLKEPIIVRAKGRRFQLVEGLHRLEAMKWLERETVDAVILPPAEAEKA
jgi:sulfiredoxin